MSTRQSMEVQAVENMLKIMEALLDHLPPLTRPDGTRMGQEATHLAYYETILKVREGMSLGRTFPPELKRIREEILKSLLQTLP